MERDADQRAKAEFEDRLKERDDAKTRKLMEKKFSKEELADIERRKFDSEEHRKQLVPELRCVCARFALAHPHSLKPPKHARTHITITTFSTITPQHYHRHRHQQ